MAEMLIYNVITSEQNSVKIINRLTQIIESDLSKLYIKEKA